MSIDPKCLICRNPDRRRMVELAWNGGMSAPAISRVIESEKMSGSTILRHMHEHTNGQAQTREIDVEEELPVRERIMNLQRLQLDEIERRIALAKQRADEMNARREGMTDADGNPFPLLDWSEFYDILDKDAQQAVNSILKTQGLTDKREAKTSELKLGLFEAMTNAGLAPKALVGGVEVPALQSGEEIEADD